MLASLVNKPVHVLGEMIASAPIAAMTGSREANRNPGDTPRARKLFGADVAAHHGHDRGAKPEIQQV
jgi:hypothetical protein